MKKTLPVLPFLFWVLTGQRNCLDGYKAVDLGVAGLIHYSHRSTTEFSDDLVSSEALTPASFHFAHRPWLRQNTPGSSLWRGVVRECSQPCHSSYGGNHFPGWMYYQRRNLCGFVGSSGRVAPRFLTVMAYPHSDRSLLCHLRR